MHLPTQKVIAPARLPLYMSITGFVLNFIAYYPGFMSPDTLDIYEQSISRHYRDWHPPLMAWLWSGLNHIYQGPQVMLVFQLAMLWASFYFLATGPFSHRRSRTLLFAGVLLAPFIQNFAGYIIKDVQMALSWVLSFSIIARANHEGRKMTNLEAFFAFGFILYGGLVRINALPGALPLFYLWFHNFLKKPIQGFRLMGAVVFSVFLVLGCQALLNGALKPQKQYPEYKLYLHDLSGIYVTTGKNYFPSFIHQHPGFDTAYLKQHYTTATIDNLYWNEENKFSFPPPLSGHQIKEVQLAWKNSLTGNFGVYLKNRWDGFLYFLRFKKRSYLVVQHAEVSANNYGITYKRNPVSEIFLRATKLQSALPYMRPWFWAVTNLVVLVATFFISHTATKKAVFGLALSSLLYLLPQFFIFQVDTDFRYFYWNCLALFIAILFLLKDGLARRKPSKD